MSIRVALRHRTSYRYDRLVSLGPQVIRLRPAPHARTKVLSYALSIHPKGHFLNWQQDPQSNWLARVVFPEKVREFSIDVDLVAEMETVNPFDFFLEPQAEHWPFDYDPILAEELRPFRRCEPAGPKLRAWLDSVPREKAQTTTFIVGLNQRLQQDIKYLVRLEPGVQTCEETLTKLSGSCRDSGWLLVQILRHLGFAARFVSGYLIQLVADEKPIDGGPAGTDHDFTDLHAWAEVYLPGAGWIGLDPTSGLLAGEGHIPLAATPDTPSAAPITGGVDECETEFGFEMSVARIHETPRVTKPYTPEQWDAIAALGHSVDADLKAGDVRLTMGGEPTFVAAFDMDAAEWNTAAVGPTKRLYAADLIRRLRARFAPGGMLLYGQGKWYPGESLPRWAFHLYWRRDGKPLWRDLSNFADETDRPDSTLADAERLMYAIADGLKLDGDAIHAAYEDACQFLAREARLPDNVDPFDSKLKDPEERARLARVFGRGLDQPVGYVLPVQRWQGAAEAPRWQTEVWRFRTGRMVLHPGDSPLGLRMPLDGLPWVPASSYPYVIEADPFAPRGELPEPRDLGEEPRDLDQRHLQGAPAAIERPQYPQSLTTGRAVRTALAIEPRDGRLHVFMPPTETADDYIALLAEVEAAAVRCRLPVTIEGYTPPRDPRLNSISVTPDPGVIEVNIQPAASWDEAVAITTGLYEDARACRLGTEKFLIDGRASGTGGGNHIVLGGPTASDSPFLRRPDLLGSLIRYWQNHPSLSYLFSGMFIGPTSQAPRIDEARNDAVYEMQIALSQLPPATAQVAPWVVDRALRHLLADLTGNTHRSEICIDKLYSPDSATGRLGLVEFRSFEMPPHAQMSLAQQLLLRALIAWFWREPFTRPLTRWGTRLHDQFMLPHYVERDFQEVIADLTRAGYAFDPAWFAPHVEFRFPRYGEVVHDGVHLDLRQALEPWLVLGEEPGAGGTVRYVDSSVERLQVTVSGLNPQRHVVTCNGRRVPLQPTDQQGVHVAGVRFRAWRAAASLHPTIGVHAPLVFDLLDSWNERSLGGCTYHVAHPGGRNYDTTPINSYEAEARRLARFYPFGHTPGRKPVPPTEYNPDFPCTLDMRFTPQ